MTKNTAKTKEEIQKLANICARKNGYQKATEIRYDGRRTSAEFVMHTDFGYRKHTTGEYVSNAYRANFGWKNTYYQEAETVIVVPKSWKTV